MNIELKSLSALFLTMSLTIPVIFLLYPINPFFLLLIFPIIVVSFIFVNYIDKFISYLRKNNGWLLIITGFLTLAIILTTYFICQSTYKEIVKTIGNYYTYRGEAQLTQHQFNIILQYSYYPDCSIKVVETNPLIVNYDFVSSANYPFLNKLKLNSVPSSAYIPYNPPILIFLIIPIFLLIIGVSDLSLDKKSQLFAENIP